MPQQDAALVVVAFVVPAQATTAEALQAVVAAAGSAGATVDDGTAGALHITDGDGPLVQSRDATIALDAVPGGYSDVEGRDTDRGPLLTVTWVPDATNAQQAGRLAQALTAGVEPTP
ncbi:hypothetical protein GCM10027446_11190 [Angustibacter peucedani]